MADVRYDLADEDSAYMAAVERGDMETAQRMVDKAAKAARGQAQVFSGSSCFWSHLL